MSSSDEEKNAHAVAKLRGLARDICRNGNITAANAIDALSYLRPSPHNVSDDDYRAWAAEVRRFDNRVITDAYIDAAASLLHPKWRLGFINYHYVVATPSIRIVAYTPTTGYTVNAVAQTEAQARFAVALLAAAWELEHGLA